MATRGGAGASTPGTSAQPARPDPSAKVKQVTREVDEVKGIMQNNVEKILQNHEQLDTIQGKSENLASSAKQFQRSSNTLKKKMWWKNMKLNLIIAAIIIAIILVITIPIVIASKKK